MHNIRESQLENPVSHGKNKIMTGVQNYAAKKSKEGELLFDSALPSRYNRNCCLQKYARSDAVVFQTKKPAVAAGRRRV